MDLLRKMACWTGVCPNTLTIRLRVVTGKGHRERESLRSNKHTSAAPQL